MDQESIRAELKQVLARPNQGQALRHYVRHLASAGVAGMAVELLEVFHEDDFPMQSAAGGILWVLAPPYTGELIRDLEVLMKGWNPSVAELPLYLARACGAEVLEQAMQGDLWKDNARQCATFHYWLSGGVSDSIDDRWETLREEVERGGSRNTAKG